MTLRWNFFRLALGAGGLGCCLGLLVGAASIARSQDQSADTPKDTIFARKILMDTIDHNMDALEEMVRTGQPIDFSEANEHGDAVSVMLMAFPHLFPPATNQYKPNVERDAGRDTFAAPEVWANFSDFYERATAASKLAYKASRTTDETTFKATMASLRTACDSCHALYLKVDQVWVDPFAPKK